MELVDKSNLTNEELRNALINDLAGIELSIKDMLANIEEMSKREIISDNLYIMSSVGTRECYNRYLSWYEMMEKEISIVNMVKRINDEVL